MMGRAVVGRLVVIGSVDLGRCFVVNDFEFEDLLVLGGNSFLVDYGFRARVF